MKKSFIFILVLSFVMLTGCSNNSKEAAVTTVAEKPQVEGVQTPEEKSEPVPEVKVEKVQELTPGEQLAIDYVNVYLNGTDLAAKKKFVDDKVHPETKQMYELAVSRVTEENKRFLNPKVVETKDYENAGAKGTLTLIKGDGDKEFIALIMDNKFGWGFISTETSEQFKQAFDEMRSLFKSK